jgi:hypothetical protein
MAEVVEGMGDPSGERSAPLNCVNKSLMLPLLPVRSSGIRFLPSMGLLLPQLFALSPDPLRVSSPLRCFSSVSLACFASKSVRGVSPNSFWRLASRSSYDSVKVFEMVLTVSALSVDGFQSIGHRTPCLATA